MEQEVVPAPLHPTRRLIVYDDCCKSSNVGMLWLKSQEAQGSSMRSNTLDKDRRTKSLVAHCEKWAGRVEYSVGMHHCFQRRYLPRYSASIQDDFSFGRIIHAVNISSACIIEDISQAAVSRDCGMVLPMLRYRGQSRAEACTAAKNVGF
jgi:hypothetical protein